MIEFVSQAPIFILSLVFILIYILCNIMIYTLNYIVKQVS